MCLWKGFGYCLLLQHLVLPRNQVSAAEAMSGNMSIFVPRRIAPLPLQAAAARVQDAHNILRLNPNK